MRSEIIRSHGIIEQLYLLFLCGLTWRLFVLKWDLDAIRERMAVELIDLSHNPPTYEAVLAGIGATLACS
jgi:hypothetical protein